MTKDIIKKGFAEAEKEQQEEQVNKIKKIVQKHLEDIAYHQEQSANHAKTAKLLKKDLDDLKAGRLDRIEERQEKDKEAREVRIIEVHKIVDRYIPLRPWLSPYDVIWATPIYSGSGSMSVTTTAGGTTNAFYASSGSGATTLLATNTGGIDSLSSMTLTGTACSNFAGGAYEVGNNIVNL